MATLRSIAEGIARCIAEDKFLHDRCHLTVVVEDKGDYGYRIAEALGATGVCVTVAVTGFNRVDRSPLLQGNLNIQISTYEHPSLNRDDPSTLTAQGAMERTCSLLHYRRFDFVPNRLIFKSFRREDTDDVNIVRADFETNVLIGLGGDGVEGEHQQEGE